MTTDEMKDYIARLRDERSQLSLKYQGVRPSWVSCDLAILGERIEQAVAELKGQEDD